MRGIAVPIILLVALSGCFDLFGLDPTPALSVPQAMVWSDPAELVVEIDYVDGREPTPFSKQRLREVLETETSKRSFTFRPPTSIDVGDTGADRIWVLDEILDLHREVFDAAAPFQHQGRDAAYLHVLFLNGRMRSGDDAYAAGVQVANLVIVFPDTVREAVALPLPPPFGFPNPSFEQAEAAILVHELGHALGLVGHGAPVTKDRFLSEEDDPCQCHSSDPDSVMYPAAERFNPIRFIQEGRFVRDQFTADDRADLAALRDLDPARR